MDSKVTAEGTELDLQEALNHLQSILEVHVCQEAERYEELRKYLLERFGRKHATRFYREQLSRLKILDNESVKEFADRIRKINANTYELEALESAINVIEDDKHPGKEQDRSVKSPGKSVVAVERNGDKCFFCHKVGYKLRDCRKRAKACFGCGQIGHLVRECPEKGKQSTVSYALVKKNVSLTWQHVVGDLELQCLQEPKFVVSGLSGHKLKNLGEIVVSIELGNAAYEMCVQVIQNDCTRYDGIIGLDFLKQYQALVNVAKQSLQLGNKLYSLGQCNDGPTSRVKDCHMGSRDPASLVKITQSPAHLVTAEKIQPVTGKIVCIMVPLPSVHVENNCTILVEPAHECDVLNKQHCYVARRVTTVMPHERKVKAPVNIVNMSRVEVEILRGTQIAVLKLLEKRDVLSFPCDVDESVVREDKQVLQSLLQEYQHIFIKRKYLPFTPLVQHRIYAGDHKPLYETVSKKSETGEIKYRFCVSYCPLNVVTTPDIYPLPNIVESIDNLGQCKIFSVVDLTSGYHQIGVHPDDHAKTSFITTTGVYKCVRLPYGLINGPTTFQNLKDNVKNMKQYVEHLTSVCDRLEKAKLSLSLEKFNFTISEVRLSWACHWFFRNKSRPIVWSVKHFRCYLVTNGFTIVTVHAALKWMLSMKDPSGRLMRWSLQLSEYVYKIQHRPGRKHRNANCMSRRVRLTEASAEENISGEQQNDEECQLFRQQSKFVEQDGLLFRETLGLTLVVPRSQQDEILKECHDSVYAGHQGKKATNRKSRANLVELTEMERTFQRLDLDIVGSMPKTASGNRYILTIIDHFSRYLVMKLLPDKTAENVARTSVFDSILKFGVPDSVITDQGTNFVSELMAQFCQLLRVKKSRTTPGHPQGNGSTERVHRTIAKMISHYVSNRHDDWDVCLPHVCTAYNSRVHTSIQLSPYEAVHG
ncbi:hypothetical protein PR048_002769 [Dryococelus australis]|uniref:RNA-directed DNA polymerase n=1 Tax=Dryococelus australis TaxID=614101 RepID=A0ABQ9IL53_9NEOP|nr:hypothetical protein PR048_002769 [Dryococelus australis]